jgi:tetratricopeptide (TPR) repeat protein
MTPPALEKIYLILGNAEATGRQRLADTLSRLFVHVNLTLNLYLATKNLPGVVSQVESILAQVGEYLEEYRYARVYVHVVHPVSGEEAGEIGRCYERLKRHKDRFDREGYMHQEVPRLMVLPLIVWHGTGKPHALHPLLRWFRSAFLPAALYVDGEGEFLPLDEELKALTEKTYYGDGYSGDISDVIFSLGCQDIVDDSSSRLESGMSVDVSCPTNLIVSATEGKIYPCMDAFSKRQPWAETGADPDIGSLESLYGSSGVQHGRCVGCRQRLAVAFSRFRLPAAIRREIGALMYHLGALHQEGGQYVEAIYSFRHSLNLSSEDEAASILFQIGLCHTMIGDYDAALDAFEQTAPEYESAHFFHFYHGLCYFHKGDYPSALEAFSKAASLAPPPEDLVRILLYMGTCHNNLGQYEAALGPLNKAGRQGDGVKEVWSALGFSYFQLKDFDRAISSLQRAVALDPLSAVDYASLGANYREKKDFSMALAMFEKALALDPGLTSAAENIKRLRRKG